MADKKSGFGTKTTKVEGPRQSAAEAEFDEVATPQDVVDPNLEANNAHLVKVTSEYMKEARSAKFTREKRNQVNVAAYHGEQDFSHKVEGQSQEFLPKIQMAVEQTAALFKKALIGSGDYYEVSFGGQFKRLFDGAEVRKISRTLLENHVDFATLIQNGVKVALLQSLLIIKVYPKFTNVNEFAVEHGTREVVTTRDGVPGTQNERTAELVRRTRSQFSVAMDLIDPKDYFPDPSGNGLYEIHRVERDVSYVLGQAERGVYDYQAVLEAIEQSSSDYERKAEEAKKAGQDISSPPGFRKKMVLDEVWGTILDEDGRILHENVLMTIANEKHVIRQPVPNPAWHGKSPFATTPLMSVPFSVWHKALYDSAVSLNFALNELFNLILDGGISEVWGIKQLRLNDLEDPRQVSNGIRQGMTLAVKDNLPANQKVLETVSSGAVPQGSLVMFNITDKEGQAASLMNDIKLGQLPTKEVKATEILEASQQSAALVDSIAKMLETNGISEALDRCWALQLQYSNEIPLVELADMVGLKKALLFKKMQPAERFVALYQGATFKVSGISATLARVKDFQKIMALLQAAASNPLLLEAFVKKYSAEKILDEVIKTLNLNPETLQNDEAEEVDVEERIKHMGVLSQLFGMGTGNGGGGNGLNNTVGDNELPSEVNQMQAPTGGF